MPASRSRTSRSTPTAAPRPAATTSRRSASHPPSAGTLLARSIDRFLLHGRELLDSLGGEIEQIVEAVAVERHAPGGRLHPHEPSAPPHHDVPGGPPPRNLD